MGARRIGMAIIIGWCVGMGFVPAADAHLKDYLVTQDYYTAKQGEFEATFWNDLNLAEANNDNSYNSKHQLELEYGVLDHLQLAYYEVYTWNRASDWERDEFKIEAKLRLAEAGQWPVDVALYTEYANPDGHRDIHSDELENKVILSKDFGRFNLTSNFIFERELNSGNPWEYEYTLGASYGLTPRTRVGLELKQRLGDSDDFGIERNKECYIVPGLYTSLTPHVRVLVGPAFGLTKVSDDVQLRSIVEVEF